MPSDSLTLRSATRADLVAINRVIEAAVLAWDLPDRVKRLALPSYRYHEHDFAHLRMRVALRNAEIVGIAAWEAADPRDAPPEQHALLLHGIYVRPDCQRAGNGRRLLEATVQLARDEGYDGLLVKAQAGAEDFFVKSGFRRLPVEDTPRRYAGRYWLPLS